jgi:hypothetical protein
MTICSVSLLMKCVALTATLEVFLLFVTLSAVRISLLLPSSPSFTTVCYTRFCINAPYEFTPTPNLHPVVFGSKLLAGLFPFICLLY